MSNNRIIKETADEFYLYDTKTHLVDTVDFYNIVDVEISEFRKDKSLYYSSLQKVRKAGIYFPNTDTVLSEYLQCAYCFNLLENSSCPHKCSVDSSVNKYFLPLYYFISYLDYTNIKNTYKLGLLEEYYRDQRINVCKPFKEELLQVVLHPDNIEKMLKIHSIHWWDLDKYI